MNLWKLSVDLLVCPTCGAAPGEPCRSRSGRKLTDHGRTCHDPRAVPLSEVWQEGYQARYGETEAWRQHARATESALAKVRAELRARLARLDGAR